MRVSSTLKAKLNMISLSLLEKTTGGQTWSAPAGKIREELANREPDMTRLLEDPLPGKVTGGEGYFVRLG